ncbi:hypothetical protein CsatB_006934 [Cannabis sativa]
MFHPKNSHLSNRPDMRNDHIGISNLLHGDKERNSTEAKMSTSIGRHQMWILCNEDDERFNSSFQSETLFGRVK